MYEETKFELNMDEFLPLRDVVFQTLRRAILTGDLKPGERLMEIQLADRIGVSRTPVREAMRKLELEGLVTMVPRKGAMVSEISEKGLKDVLELRCALDVFTAGLAAERITDNDKMRLKEACTDFERAVATNNPSIIAKADVAFHDIIIKASNNERLDATINNISEQMYRYRFEYIKDTTQHENLIKEHHILMNAIIGGDVEAAKDAARIHIDNQEKSILHQLGMDHKHE